MLFWCEHSFYKTSCPYIQLLSPRNQGLGSWMPPHNPLQIPRPTSRKRGSSTGRYFPIGKNHKRHKREVCLTKRPGHTSFYVQTNNCAFIYSQNFYTQLKSEVISLCCLLSKRLTSNLLCSFLIYSYPSVHLLSKCNIYVAFLIINFS